MILSKKLILSTIIGLIILSNIVQATHQDLSAQDLMENKRKQIIANVPAPIFGFNAHITSHILSYLSLEEIFNFLTATKDNAAILYNAAHWQNFLNKRYNQVPQNIFENPVVIWINTNTAEEIESRKKIFQDMQNEYFRKTGALNLTKEQFDEINQRLVNLRRRTVSPAFWILSNLPTFEATKNPRDLDSRLQGELKSIDARIAREEGFMKSQLELVKANFLNAQSMPSSMEVRVAFLEKFEDLMKARPFMFSAKGAQWSVTPYCYNDITDPNCTWETLLTHTMNYDWQRYQFVNGIVVGSGRLERIQQPAVAQPDVAQN